MSNRPRTRDSDLGSLQDVFFGLKRHDSEQEWAQTMKERNKKVKEVSDSLNLDEDKLVDPTSTLYEKDVTKVKDDDLTEKEQNFYNNIIKFVNVPKEQRQVFPTLSKFESNLPEDLFSERRTSMYDESHIPGAQKPIRQSSDELRANGSQSGKERNKAIFDESIFVPLQTQPSNESMANRLNLVRDSSVAQIPIAEPEEPPQRVIPDNPKLAKYKNLAGLYLLLKKHFKGQDISDKDVKITNVEMSILKSIIQRKYKSKVNLNTKNFLLRDKLNSINKLGTNKRPEENYKFVFKRCLKHMKDNLRISTDKKHKKKEQERQFYEHYFKRIAEAEGLSIQQFFHPKNSKSKYKDAPKTINADYIANISKSAEFVHDFLDYMHNSLKVDYEKTIDTKIDGLIKKWNDMYEQSTDREHVIEEICEYIEKNKKCKLPWSEKEIQEATGAVDKLFAEYAQTK